MKKALLVIDLQNDYFPGGLFPLWNTEETLERIEKAIELANNKGIQVIHIQHVADPKVGIAPFFNEGTHGVEIHERILKAATNAPVVVKHYADAFYETDLEEVLSTIGAEELLICGMMTQNCVTHTAISKAAEKYKVKILQDCCTSISAPIHQIGLHAVITRVDLQDSNEALN